jgi:pimeloyl-ACP methyl ester carboxylesterase
VLAVHALLAGPAARPPIILVHGAANSSLVWRFWQPALADRGWSSWALDLRGHGTSPAADLARATMTDYADDVVALMTELARLAVVVGWSMGGLVAAMAAARQGGAAWIGLAPSPPARERDRAAPLGEGTFGPEVVASTADATFPPTAYADLPLAAERLVVDGASHWGLVLNRRLLATLVPAALDWISRVAPAPAGARGRSGL